MMRSLTSLVAAVVVMAACFGSSAQAEEIPGDVLSQIGLGGMQKMSDADGMKVRGQGFAAVGGIGLSTVILATDLDGYVATSGPIPNALATGSSQTTSQVGISFDVSGLGLQVASVSATIFAATAGSSFAFAR